MNFESQTLARMQKLKYFRLLDSNLWDLSIFSEHVVLTCKKLSGLFINAHPINILQNQALHQTTLCKSF